MERFTHAFVPVHMEELAIWDRRSDGLDFGMGTAHGELRGLPGAYANIQMLSSSGAPLLSVSNMRCVSYASNDEVATNGDSEIECPFSRLIWKPDINALSNDQARKVFPPLVSAETIAPTMKRLEMEFAHMVSSVAKEYGNWSMSTLSPQLRAFLLWATKAIPTHPRR